MNLFFLYRCVRCNARAYMDKHCIKLILEITQMLYAAHWLLVGEVSDATLAPVYRLTHAAHPMVRWVCAAPGNYVHAARVALALCAEKRRRWPARPPHKCEAHLEWLRAHPPQPVRAWGDVLPPYQKKRKRCQGDTDALHAAKRQRLHGNLDVADCTPVPLCMPACYQQDNAYDAYRAYLRGEKRHLATWKRDDALCAWYNDTTTTMCECRVE